MEVTALFLFLKILLGLLCPVSNHLRFKIIYDTRPATLKHFSERRRVCPEKLELSKMADICVMLPAFRIRRVPSV